MHNGKLLARLIDEYKGEACSVLDVGSAIVCGSNRQVCRACGIVDYTGIDIRKEPGVDIVVTEVGHWNIGRWPLIISTSTLEHVRWPWIWIRQIANTLQRGGHLIVIAPYAWRVHRHPRDCWRVLPDGMTALFQWANLETVDCGMEQVSKTCGDTYGVARWHSSEI